MINSLSVVILSFLLLSGGLNAKAESTHPNSPKQIILDNSLKASEIDEGRHFFADFGTKTNFSFKEKGAFAGVGYRWNFFGVDLQMAYSQTQYQSIQAMLDSSIGTGTGYASAGSNLEINRLRNPEDSWTLFWLEPGLSIEGQLLANALPLFSERARVGLAWGSLHDQANNISFTAWLFTVETALIYQLGKSSPWSLSAALKWNTGNAVSTANPSALVSDRTLPINWIDTNFALLYNF